MSSTTIADSPPQTALEAKATFAKNSDNHTNSEEALLLNKNYIVGKRNYLGH